MNTLSDILNERRKQIGRGFTLQHDLEHSLEEMASAAAAYLLNLAEFWPWEKSAFKPARDLGVAREDVIKAAAILLAAIDAEDAGVEAASKQALSQVNTPPDQ